ncbi:histidinol-phosphatase [Jannaschia sp. 2305UL9-9]|uniref:histidinol-phosphatase n=1 Tax=Jannaschia sp. 2305UL9-9 TaxID=3121638 RepID=UPI00352853B6
MHEPDLTDLRVTAHRLAEAAREITLKHFRTPLSVISKRADFDPVTEADRQAEAAMRDILAKVRPDDAILGEEQGIKAGTSGLTWVLDPIDGTRGYISGTPTWGVLIAVQDATGPIYGMIDQPFTGERFEGAAGRATWTRGTDSHPIAVRDTTDLSQATILTTFPEVGTAKEGAAFHRLANGCRLTRYGMDCYGYALLAAGHVDLVVEAGLQPYDIAAPIAVIEAAGGMVTDWQGGSAHDGGQVLAAATPALHAKAMEHLNG